MIERLPKVTAHRGKDLQLSFEPRGAKEIECALHFWLRKGEKGLRTRLSECQVRFIGGIIYSDAPLQRNDGSIVASKRLVRDVGTDIIGHRNYSSCLV